MPHDIWQKTTGLLAAYYGTTDRPEPPGSWTTLVHVVLQPARGTRRANDWTWVAESPLADPAETAEYDVGRLAEILEAAGHRPVLARPLHGLAAWWRKRFGDADATDLFATRSVEAWREELRSIPGVNWELTDRILLFVGGCTVYPLDRGSLRIAARHGWMDLSADYDDWQAFFTAAAHDAALDLGQLSRWHALVARDFCKTQPHCDECPLKSLLPERGMMSIEGEDS